MTKDRIEDWDPIMIEDDCIDNVDRACNPHPGSICLLSVAVLAG